MIGCDVGQLASPPYSMVSPDRTGARVVVVVLDVDVLDVDVLDVVVTPGQ